MSFLSEERKGKRKEKDSYWHKKKFESWPNPLIYTDGGREGIRWTGAASGSQLLTTASCLVLRSATSPPLFRLAQRWGLGSIAFEVGVPSLLCKASCLVIRHCFGDLMFYHQVTNNPNFLFRTVDVMSLPFFPRCSAPGRH